MYIARLVIVFGRRKKTQTNINTPVGFGYNFNQRILVNVIATVAGELPLEMNKPYGFHESVKDFVHFFVYTNSEKSSIMPSSLSNISGNNNNNKKQQNDYKQKRRIL